jgi:hypothetical protein
MTPFSRTRSLARWLALVVGAAGAAYATYVATAWFRYGHTSRSASQRKDSLLDRFMLVYDVAEHHHIRVNAPAEITLAAAAEADLVRSPIARAIFRAREIILGAEPDWVARPSGLLALTQSIVWRVLAEVPDREIVVGAVTQPWTAHVTFRGLSPDEFATFNEPGYVKIAWTLRADAITPMESMFHTETRAVATDAFARAKFRRYWSFLSPGIIAIRALMLQPVKAEAERRARVAVCSA